MVYCLVSMMYVQLLGRNLISLAIVAIVPVASTLLAIGCALF